MNINPDDFRPKLIRGRRVPSPEYRSWQMMKNRCLNPNAQDARHYQAKGVTLCERWHSFDAFIRDMGPKPSPGLTLERRNVELGYTPENCYWADRRQQARNRSFIQRYRGKTTWEWAEELGIKPMSFHMRLWRFRKGQITEDQLFRSRK